MVEPFEDTRITKISSTSLDQLIIILEISFIFLLSYSLITLVDAALNSLELYDPIATLFLGEEGVGQLDGGNFERITRVTLIFNLLLFAFSLFFGLWIRRTRDGWSWNQLGYTLKTPGYSSSSLIRRGILLGLIAIAAFYTILTPLKVLLTGDLNSALLIHSFQKNGVLFTAHQLNAEYYYGIIEMGFIWPLSAGFFFFAYAHNSLKSRFPLGVANLLSSLFYVFYLAFFFVIIETGKLAAIPIYVVDPMFWGMIFSLFIILYISFSAFTETGSVVLPFLLNFVLNVGLTVFKAFNSLFYASTPASLYPLMLIPYLLTLVTIGIWFFVKKEDFSTIKLGLRHMKDVFNKKTREGISFLSMIGIICLFIILSFIVPGVLELVVTEAEQQTITREIFSLVYAFIYIAIIGVAIIVLTYEPSKVYDVLLVKMPDGIPIDSRIKLFQSDEVLISGFFTAISTVSKELDDAEKTDLRSIKRGEREILIEDGVFTRIIALVDRDQERIRQSIVDLLRKFEVTNTKKLTEWLGDTEAIPESKELLTDMSALSIRFDIPQQTRWIGVLTLILTPLMIGLIGLI
ncbi:MAG: hypothetical protein ACXAEU_22840 [Candidatus Hodarchaeales archaeon]